MKSKLVCRVGTNPQIFYFFPNRVVRVENGGCKRNQVIFKMTWRDGHKSSQK